MLNTRRQFCAFGAVAALGAPSLAAAQEFRVNPGHYQAVEPRQPTKGGPGQVDVVEFFAYSCPHCQSFEPAIDAWQRKLPPHVLFRRVPVAFRKDLVIHQQLYYTIESLGLVDTLHPLVYKSIQRLRSLDDTAAFATANGVDRTRFIDTMQSFAIASKSRQASLLATGYKIEGTPSIGIDGRWLTSGLLAGSNQRSLAVTEHLIALAMKNR